MPRSWFLCLALSLRYNLSWCESLLASCKASNTLGGALLMTCLPWVPTIQKHASQEPRTRGFLEGGFCKMSASLGCGALSAKCTAGANALGIFCFLGRDTGLYRNPLCCNPLFLVPELLRRALRWKLMDLRSVLWKVL